MSPRRWLSGLLWISLAVALTPAGARAADTNAVLNEWLAAQTKLHTWTADFTQTRTLKALTQPLIATGHLWFAAPNRFRWELRWPAPTIALRQTDQMLVIYPRLKRAERYPLSGNAAGEWREALALLDAGFPHSRADFQSRFRVQSLTGTNGAWQLTLVPSRAFARRMMKEIRVELAAGDFSLVSTELMFADDSRLRNTFTNAVLNAQFDESVFNWKPEPDFKITEPLGK